MCGLVGGKLEVELSSAGMRGVESASGRRVCRADGAANAEGALCPASEGLWWRFWRDAVGQRRRGSRCFSDWIGRTCVNARTLRSAHFTRDLQGALGVGALEDDLCRNVRANCGVGAVAKLSWHSKSRCAIPRDQEKM